MSRAGERQLCPRGSALLAHRGAETVGFGGASPGVEDSLAGLLDKLLLLDQPAEIRFVNGEACDRLDAALQLQQREDGWHQLEDDGIVFDLGPHPRDPSRENAAVVADHRLADRGSFALAASPPRLLDEPRLIEKLVTL